MVHKMHRNISSWISKNAHQSQIRFKVSLTARSLKQIFVFSLDVNILCLPWKGNEIRTSHGIERGENLYSNWRTGFGYLWNFWDSWYFYWIFGSIDFFYFFDFLESESEKHREGEREREAQLDKNAYLQIVFPSLIMMKRIPFHEENRWSGERKRASERGAGKFLRERWAQIKAGAGSADAQKGRSVERK